MTTAADCIPSQGIDLGYCGVNQTVTKQFTIQNPYSNLIRFDVQAESSPFVITPLSGKL
jgi:hypothetical protein